MATYRQAAASGMPFNTPYNEIHSSTSGSWVTAWDKVPERAVRVQGIYYSSMTPGATLRIRDMRRPTTSAELEGGAIWYDAQCIGGSPAIDLFPAHLTLFTPFQYFDSEGGNIIIIYGEFV